MLISNSTVLSRLSTLAWMSFLRSEILLLDGEESSWDEMVLLYPKKVEGLK